jgi:hypothetical protein
LEGGIGLLYSTALHIAKKNENTIRDLYFLIDFWICMCGSPLLGESEQMEERLSNSSSVSSPTLDDILDSLLALRRPNKKIKSRGGTPAPTLMKAGKLIAILEL